MEDIKNKTVTVQHGRFKEKAFCIEDDIANMPPQGGGTDLPSLAMGGNWAARDALEIDKYVVTDAPFYYGKIGGLGHIISKHDLGI